MRSKVVWGERVAYAAVHFWLSKPTCGKRETICTIKLPVHVAQVVGRLVLDTFFMAEHVEHFVIVRYSRWEQRESKNCTYRQHVSN